MKKIILLALLVVSSASFTVAHGAPFTAVHGASCVVNGITYTFDILDKNNTTVTRIAPYPPAIYVMADTLTYQGNPYPVTRITGRDGLNILGVNTSHQYPNPLVLTLPKHLVQIDSSAYFGCTGMTSVTCPETIKSFGASAFSYCFMLDTVIIYNPTPPDAKKNTFAYSSATFKVYVPNASVPAYQAAYYWKGLGDRVQPLSDFGYELTLVNSSPKVIKSLSGAKHYAAGESVFVEAEFYEGFVVFSGWYSGSTCLSEANPYTFNMPFSDLRLNAVAISKATPEATPDTTPETTPEATPETTK